MSRTVQATIAELYLAKFVRIYDLMSWNRVWLWHSKDWKGKKEQVTDRRNLVFYTDDSLTRQTSVLVHLVYQVQVLDVTVLFSNLKFCLCKDGIGWLGLISEYYSHQRVRPLSRGLTQPRSPSGLSKVLPVDMVPTEWREQPEEYIATRAWLWYQQPIEKNIVASGRTNLDEHLFELQALRSPSGLLEPRTS